MKENPNIGRTEVIRIRNKKGTLLKFVKSVHNKLKSLQLKEGYMSQQERFLNDIVKQFLSLSQTANEKLKN